MNLPIVFVIVALIEGVFFSFVFPFGQTPDEITHYGYISDEYGLNKYIEEITIHLWQDGGYGTMVGNSDVKVDRSHLEEIKSIKFTETLKPADFNINYKMVRHLPCAIGLIIGIILHLSIIHCTYLAEIFSLLFYLIIGYITIRIVPIKKDIFMFCLLIPMTIQQCTSVNYDSVLIPCSFLLFSYILYLLYRDEKVLWKDLIIVVLLTFVIGTIKPPYVLLTGTILIIPHDKWQLRLFKFEISKLVYKYRIIAMIISAFALVFLLYVGRHNPYIKTIFVNIICFSDYANLLKGTLHSMGYGHLSGVVGTFGWLETSLSGAFVIAFYMIMTYLNTNTVEDIKDKLGKKSRIYLLIIAVILTLVIYLIFQTWSYGFLGYDKLASVESYKEYLTSLSYILGIQGRYFIPILPVFLISLSGKTRRISEKFYYIIQIVYYLVFFAESATVIYNRYW